jgi:hypothetical protein
MLLAVLVACSILAGARYYYSKATAWMLARPLKRKATSATSRASISSSKHRYTMC